MKKFIFVAFALTLSSAAMAQEKCLEQPLNVCVGHGDTANPNKIGANSTGHKGGPDGTAASNRNGHASTNQ